MRKNLITAVFLALLLSACGDNEKTPNGQQAQAQDGVPSVEIKEINGKQAVFLDGKIIKASEFRDKYCLGKSGNETCNKVVFVAQMDSTTSGGAMPRNW